MSTAALASLPQPDTLSKKIRADLIQQSRSAQTFQSLFSRWEREHGTNAVSPLIALASDSKIAESQRYVAIMGAAKLGGTEIAPALKPLLQDKNWMIRSGTLRALQALAHPSTAESVIPLLRDPALVVRAEAVNAVEKLKPIGAAEALLQAIESPSNYHQGKAQWIPIRALGALATLHAKSAAPRLLPLLNRTQDSALLKQTIQTLEALTGRKHLPGAGLLAQAKEWRRELTASGTALKP